MSCERIGTKKLDYYVNNPGAVIIDLRDRNDYIKGHVRGAINVPFDNFDREFRIYGQNVYINNMLYSANSIFVCYCDRGANSLMICSQMSDYGLNFKSVAGGFFHYNGKYLD